MNRALYVLVLSLVMTATSGAQQSAIARADGRNITPAQIDSTVNRLIQAAHVTGAGVALFHDGKVVYLKTYGLRDAEKNLPLTPDSVMAAASLTKSAFATVVMRLVQRGVLNLDKPIEQYLGKPLGDFAPYTDLKGDPRTAKLTLRILLDHTTGFANFRGLEDDHKLHIHYDPGTHYGYSGEGINLAQFVVEMVPGLRFPVSVFPYATPGSFRELKSRTKLFYSLRYSYKESFNQLPLVVLVDKDTWSAAEYLPAALQDNKAALIVGELTGGAGCGYTNDGIPTVLRNSRATVQMPDCIRLRANGSNEVEGITPDVLVAWTNRDTPFQRVHKLELALEAALRKEKATRSGSHAPSN